MAKRKLRVGDLVKGKPNNGCLITDERMELGEVVEIKWSEILRVKILSYPTNEREVSEIYSIPLEGVEFVGRKKETIVIYRNDNKVVALDKSTGEKAEARCNPTDKFDFHVGAKLAFNRLMGDEIKTDSKEVKEVKRVAKVGEYVKIVEPALSFGLYKRGDVLKIISVDKVGRAVIETDRCDLPLIKSEYVVLENYQPDKSEDWDEFDEAAMATGRMIKALESDGGLTHCEAIDFVKDVLIYGGK